MQAWLSWVLYGVIGVLFLVLGAGVINLARTDKNARTRSNKLMRLRVLVQFIAIVVIVILGVVAGAFNR